MKILLCALFSWYFPLHSRRVNSSLHRPQEDLLQSQEQNLFGDNSPNRSTSLSTLGIVYLILAIQVGMKWYLPAILICISLMTSDAKHLSMCLLAIFSLHPPLAKVAVLQLEIGSFVLSKRKYINLVILKPGKLVPQEQSPGKIQMPT